MYLRRLYEWNIPVFISCQAVRSKKNSKYGSKRFELPKYIQIVLQALDDQSTWLEKSSKLKQDAVDSRRFKQAQFLKQ